MLQTNQRALGRALLSAVLLLAAGCRARTADKNSKGKAAVAVVVIDASGSSQSPNQTEACSQVLARARDQLEARPKAKAVAFAAVTTGSDASGNEPIPLVDLQIVWRERQSFEAVDAGAKRERAWLAEISAQCQRRWPGEQPSSPILSAAARAAQTARVQRREFEVKGASVVVSFYLHSDLRSTEPAISAHLAPQSRKKLPSLPALDTSGLDTIVACGVSNFRGPSQGDVRRVDEVWQQIITGLSITTSCPTFSLPEAK